MPLLGFTVLKEKLLDGSKTQTIRKPRKIPLKVGDKLYIYFAMRTKNCEKLGEAIIIKIVRKEFQDITETDAVRDGFSTLKDFRLAFAKIHKDLFYIDAWSQIQQRYPPIEFDVITFEWTNKEASPRKTEEKP